MKDCEYKQIETVSSNNNNKKKILERKLYEFLENYAEENKGKKIMANDLQKLLVSQNIFSPVQLMSNCEFYFSIAFKKKK